MEKKYCVWCGEPYERPIEECPKCHKNPNPKENMFINYLKENTKDKFKGDAEDKIYELIKNYLLSHLYGIVLTVSLVTAATVTVVNGSNINQVSERPNELKTFFPVEERFVDSDEQNIDGNNEIHQEPEDTRYSFDEELQKEFDALIYYYAEACRDGISPEEKTKFWSSNFDTYHQLGECYADESFYGFVDPILNRNVTVWYDEEDGLMTGTKTVAKARSQGYEILRIRVEDSVYFSEEVSEIDPNYHIYYEVYMIKEDGQWKILQELTGSYQTEIYYNEIL